MIRLYKIAPSNQHESAAERKECWFVVGTVQYKNSPQENSFIHFLVQVKGQCLYDINSHDSWIAMI